MIQSAMELRCKELSEGHLKLTSFRPSSSREGEYLEQAQKGAAEGAEQRTPQGKRSTEEAGGRRHVEQGIWQGGRER